MNSRPWQRQPGESPADFTAFAHYLRLKGRRSHRAAAAQSGRSLCTIRRLSARPARVAALETRLLHPDRNTVGATLGALGPAIHVVTRVSRGLAAYTAFGVYTKMNPSA